VRLTASDDPIDFDREGYDVAIRVSDHPLPTDVRVTELFPEFVGLVASPSFLERHQIERPEHLKGLPILRTRTRLHAWDHWAAMYDIGTHTTFKDYDHFYFVLEAAAAGLGACIAPWSLVIEDVAAGKLGSPFGFVPSGQCYIVARRLEKRRKIERFCDWLTSEAKATSLPVQIVGTSGRRIVGL
jgi:LysR family glycine cleavage system transcriptional activator